MLGKNAKVINIRVLIITVIKRGQTNGKRKNVEKTKCHDGFNFNFINCISPSVNVNSITLIIILLKHQCLSSKRRPQTARMEIAIVYYILFAFLERILVLAFCHVSTASFFCTRDVTVHGVDNKTDRMTRSRRRQSA